MKILNALILVMTGLLPTTNIQAQYLSVPNGSFENWTTIGGIPSLDQWTTTAAQPSDTISPSPSIESFDSVYSLQLKTKYVNGAGVQASLATIRYPISQWTPTYFNGFYKSKRTGIGSAIVKVNAYKNNIKIGDGLLNIFDTTGNFKNFTLAINYAQAMDPDEVEIVFLSDDIINYALNNTLWIDQITLSTFPLLINENLQSLGDISVYPNPVKDILNIEVTDKENTEIRIISLTGQELIRTQIHNGNNRLCVDFLTSGIYWLETSISGKRVRARF